MAAVLQADGIGTLASHPERAPSERDATLCPVTVTQFLRLAPFSLGTVTILLAAGGLIFGHAIGRYGDDAAISFLLRWRFALAALLVFAAPTLMLVSFARGTVPTWLTEGRAAAIVGLGIATTVGIVSYLLLWVSRPDRFLATVGRRITVRRLNRYALATRWSDSDEFKGDIAARRYRWFGLELHLGSTPKSKVRWSRRARWAAVVGWMQVRRLVLRSSRTDPSEVLFDAAAAGLRNGSMRTWRAALAVIGRRLQGASLDPAAVGHLISNAQALEEIAHRQGSEDCKVRLCSALGVVGSVRMSDESAEVLAKGISSLAERRLGEHRPVLSAINALEQMGTTNAVAAVRTAGWLGQHLASLPPPAAVYGFDGDRLEHPTRALFALLGELARQADKQSGAPLNDAVIDACSMIARKLPGAQDRETIDVLVSAVGDAGVAAARRYGAGADWHGTHDASATLLRLHESIQEIDDEGAESAAEWVAEVIGRMGCWVVANRTPLSFRTWNGRSDMSVWLAHDILQLQHESVGKAFVELIVRQHNSKIPRANRDAFIRLCQGMSGELLGLARVLDDVDQPEEQA